MNYRVQLVIGEEAEFFLEEWEPGGIVIAPVAIGLFPARPGRGEQLEAILADYGLKRATFDSMALLKVGFSREWTWTRIRWPQERRFPHLVEAVRRIEAALESGLNDERKLELLRLVQHMVKRHGPPASVEGEIDRPHGRKDPVSVHRTGIIAYDRTPHPLPLLQEAARIAAGS